MFKEARRHEVILLRFFREVLVNAFILQNLQSDLNTKIFEDLVQFVENSHKGFLLTDKNHGNPEIPTAALVTGKDLF